MRSKEHYKTMYKYHEANGGLAYSLDVFGDEIAEREGYKELSGIEAVQFYIVHKFHWLPSQVKAMSSDDLRFVLAEELSGWTLPKEAQP